jgi:hypothetical protein
MGIHAYLAQASACADPDGKRPLPAARLTRFEERNDTKNGLEQEGRCFKTNR